MEKFILVLCFIMMCVVLFRPTEQVIYTITAEQADIAVEQAMKRRFPPVNLDIKKLGVKK